MSELIKNQLPKKDTDYIGFTFNGIHSSQLGIVRTSEGSRFNENLLPAIQDKTVQVPGGDGAYYLGSYFTQRQFNISYAFDSLTEQQLAKIKQVFGDKKIHELIFDEIPYKIYKAKVTGTASIKHIPFAEGKTERIYKGEGSIQFTAFEPFAKSTKKYADEYEQQNFKEWKEAAKLLETQGEFDRLIGNSIKLYNPGDRESDFIITFNFGESNFIPQGAIAITTNDGEIYQLNFRQMMCQGKDDQIKINSKLNLIEGYFNGQKSGNLYNKYITSGQFFKIPMSTEVEKPIKMTLEDSYSLTSFFENIEYDYVYF